MGFHSYLLRIVLWHSSIHICAIRSIDDNAFCGIPESLKGHKYEELVMNYTTATEQLEKHLNCPARQAYLRQYKYLCHVLLSQHRMQRAFPFSQLQMLSLGVFALIVPSSILPQIA